MIPVIVLVLDDIFLHTSEVLTTRLVWRRFAAALLPRLLGNNIPGHTTRAPPVGFEPGTNGIQFYAIANLDKTISAAGSSR